LFTRRASDWDRRALSNAGGTLRRHTIRADSRSRCTSSARCVPPTANGSRWWAQADEARITPIGRVPAELRLDELPQLFNVLTGDMNIVGPRPEQPTIFVYLREHIEGYQPVSGSDPHHGLGQIKPGI